MSGNLVYDDYVCPPEYHVFERDNRYLVIDPVNHLWFATDELGRKCIDAFAENGRFSDIAGAVAEAVNLPNDDPQITNYAAALIESLFNTGFLHKSEYKPRSLPNQPLQYPATMYLHLTASCNLKCSYCYNQEHRSNFLDSIKAEIKTKATATGERTSKFLSILDEAAANGLKEVKLTGGEATLYKDFLTVARHAKGLGLYINLLTNGALINAGNASQIVECVDSVSVSLDSATPDGGHDAVRGMGSHDKALSAIVALRQAGLQRLHVNGVVTPATLSGIEDLLDFAHEALGAEMVTLAGSAIQVTDPTKKWNAAEHMLDSDQYREYENRQYHYYRDAENPQPIDFRNQCGVGNGVVSLDPNGDVYPCQTLHEKEFLMGNAFEQGLSAVLATSAVGANAKRANVDAIPECQDCPVRYICSSGCRSEAWTREGDLYARNKEMCPTYFENAQQRLWDSVDAASH